MAGTTIDEGGIVYDVLRDAVEHAIGHAVPDAVLAAWTGTSKYEAIVGLLGACGADPATAPRVYAEFSAELDERYESNPAALVPGVGDAVAALRESGVQVALQTGYRREVAETLLATVGWRVGTHIDALVTSDEVAASRPAPYLIFRTMEATGVTHVDEVLVAGDTANDLVAGEAAGAAMVVGVLTGADDAARLGRVRHTHLVESAALLPALIAVHGSGETD